MSAVRAPAGGRLSLDLHRVAEIAVGAALVSVSLHVTGSAATLAAGMAVMAPALVTRGRLGVVRWCSPACHRVLDVLLIAALALLPLVPHTEGAALAAITEPAAAVLLLLLVRTDYRARGRAEPRPRTPPPPPSGPPPPPSGPPLVDRTARRLGRLAGIVERAARAAVDRDRD